VSIIFYNSFPVMLLLTRSTYFVWVVLTLTNHVLCMLILSRVLFCLNIEDLLLNLSRSGVGCHVGTRFVHGSARIRRRQLYCSAEVT